MSAYFKTLLRSIRSNLGRFIAITFIIMLGIAFVSGLGTLSYTVESSFNKQLKDNQVSDLIVKSMSVQGLSDKQINSFKSYDKVKNVQPFTMFDLDSNGLITRIYVMPLSELSFNKMQIVEGNLPTTEDEVVVERKSNYINHVNIGDAVTVMDMTKTVCGIVANPLMCYVEGEPSQLDKKPLQQVIYVDKQYFDMAVPYTDMYVELDVVKDNYFSKNYINAVNTEVKNLKNISGNRALIMLTLKENKSVAVMESYSGKIDVITYIFPVFFIAVAALVVLTTMTRMVEEDRASIGCYKTLGFTDSKIIFKYVGFSTLCCSIGSLLGVILGVTILPRVIYPAFNILFFMPPMLGAVKLTLGLIAVACMFLALTAVTFFLIKKELSAQPANLLRPKAPKAGKKIFLEYIPIIWNRFSFRYKSTLRNIFRYTKHLIMTVTSVAGSSALVLAGFGLLDISKGGDNTGGDFQVMAESFSMISGVVIAFAVLLCILVIYNLTNMNIGERKREIATLNVLGYREGEVAGYIYREIFIMAILGVAVGLPLGFGLLAFIFEYLEFGAIGDVEWYSYLLSAVLVIAVIGVVDLMLWPKIKKVDMTSSLKTVE